MKNSLFCGSESSALELSRTDLIESGSCNYVTTDKVDNLCKTGTLLFCRLNEIMLIKLSAQCWCILSTALAAFINK